MSNQGSSRNNRDGKKKKSLMEMCRLVAGFFSGCEKCKKNPALQKLIGPFKEALQRAEDEEKSERGLKRSPRTTVRKQLPKVLRALLEEAKKGNCQHAKLLFEFADAANLPDAQEQKGSQSLAEMLLSKLK